AWGIQGRVQTGLLIGNFESIEGRPRLASGRRPLLHGYIEIGESSPAFGRWSDLTRRPRNLSRGCCPQCPCRHLAQGTDEVGAAGETICGDLGQSTADDRLLRGRQRRQ